MDHFIFYGYEFLSSFIPFLIVFTIFKIVNMKKALKLPWLYDVSVMIFAFYIIAVYHFTGAGTLYDGLVYQLEIKHNQLNFIPFSNTIDMTAYLLNILLFIPFGALVPLIWKKCRCFVCVTSAGFAFSFFIELSQLLNNRRSDIDDLILNTVGAAAGLVLYQIWNKCTKGKFQSGAAPAAELPVYLLTMFAGRFLLYNEIGLARLLYGF